MTIAAFHRESGLEPPNMSNYSMSTVLGDIYTRHMFKLTHDFDVYGFSKDGVIKRKLVQNARKVHSIRDVASRMLFSDIHLHVSIANVLLLIEFGNVEMIYAISTIEQIVLIRRRWSYHAR